MEQQKKTKYPALQHRDFRVYLAGQFFSLVGSQMQFVGINWQIYTLTNSAIALGMIGLARYIPIAIFSLIGGAAADSFNRKKIQMTASIVLAILAACLAVLTWTNTITPQFIYLFTILSAIASSFDNPSRQAFVPNLVEKKHLPQAMSMSIMMFQTSTIIGPAIGGFVIAWFGLAPIYAYNALSFIIFIITLLNIKNDGKPENTEHVVSIGAMFDSFKFIRSKTILWSTMILDFFSTFFASATSLLPIFARDILHVGPVGVGFLYAAASVGAVIAGLIMTHLHHIKKQGLLLLGGVTVYAIATILFGVSTNFALSFIALMLIGAGDSVSTIIRNTIRQLETPDRLRGRMSAINMIFVMGGPQLGEFEAGLLAAAVGGPASVVMGGFGTLIIIAILIARIPSLKAYTHPIDNLSDALT